MHARLCTEQGLHSVVFRAENGLAPAGFRLVTIATGAAKVQTVEQASKSEKLFRVGGLRLIAVGFATPQLKNMSMSEGAVAAGSDIARSFGELLLPALKRRNFSRSKCGTVCRFPRRKRQQLTRFFSA